MADGGNVIFYFKGDDKQLQSTIDGVSKSLSSLSSGSLEALGTGFTRLGGIVTATAGAVVGFGASYNAEIESITMSLETLLGSEEEALTAMESIKQNAVKTPFDVRSLAKGEQMLISTGISAEGAETAILALGDAVSATGGSNDTMTRMIANLQQIKNAGKASAVDIRQFAYAGIDIYGLLSDSMGKSTEEIQNMVSKGQIGYNEIIQAMQKASSEGGKFYGAMEKQSHTLNGMISNLKDNAGNLAGTMSSGVTNGLKAVLPSLNHFIDRLEKLFTQNKNFQALSEGFLKLGTSISIVLSNLTDDQIQSIIDFVVALTKTTPLLLGIGAILPKIGNAIGLIFGPAVGIIDSLGGLVQHIPVLNAVFDIFSGLVSPLVNILTALAQFGLALTAIAGVLGFVDTQMNGKLTEWSQLFATKGYEMINNLINSFVANIPAMVEQGQGIITNLVVGISNVMPTLISAVDTIIQSISSTLLTNGPQIAKVVTDTIMGLMQILYKNEGGFLKATLKILLAILQSIKDNLPDLLEASQQGINDMIEVIIDFMPSFMQAGVEIILALVDGFIKQLPVLIDRIPLMVDMLVTALIYALPMLIEGGIRIVTALQQGVMDNLPKFSNLFIETLKRIFNSVLKLAMTSFLQIGHALMQQFGEGISNKVQGVAQKIQGFIQGVISQFRGISLWDIGANLLTGLWNGISNKVGWVTNKIRGMSSSIISAIKNVFGVHSPSKEFAWIGEMNMQGLAQGMLGGQKEVQGIIDGAFNLQPNVNPTMTITQESSFADLFANYQERPVMLDIRADEGIIVQKATEGFREFQRANGRLPF